MKSPYIHFIFGLVVGVVLMMGLRFDRCKVNTKKVYEIVHDTIVFKVPTIPKPKIYYRTRLELDTIVQHDKWIEYVNLIDSIYLDTTKRDLPINRYVDCIDQDSVKLDYIIETFGFLTKFEPTLTIKQRNLSQKHWVVGLGLSDKANWKGSIGYKGWMTEIEFSNGYKFNQLYITKQFQF